MSYEPITHLEDLRKPSHHQRVTIEDMWPVFDWEPLRAHLDATELLRPSDLNSSDIKLCLEDMAHLEKLFTKADKLNHKRLGALGPGNTFLATGVEFNIAFSRVRRLASKMKHELARRRRQKRKELAQRWEHPSE